MSKKRDASEELLFGNRCVCTRPVPKAALAEMAGFGFTLGFDFFHVCGYTVIIIIIIIIIIFFFLIKQNFIHRFKKK